VHPRKTVRDFFGFATSQYIVRVLLVLRGLIAARLLGPAAYGAWNGLMLVLDYGALSPLGTIQGLDQTVAPAIVAGDAARLRRLKQSGLFLVLLFGVAYGLACWFYFSRNAGQLRVFWHLTGIGLILLVTLLQNVAGYHMCVLRAHGNIRDVSLVFLIQAMLGAAVGILLLPFFGAWGLLWGWLTGTIAMLLYARWRGHGEVPIVPRASRETLTLLVAGFPMFAYAGLTLLMRSLDRVVILRFLGTEALGYYGLGVMVMGMLLYLPDSLGYVLYPRLLRDYTAAEGDPEAIRAPVERSMRAISLALPALCALAFIAADDVVIWLLPRFLSGVPTVRVLCFAAAAMGLGSLSAIVLMTVRRPRVMVGVSVVAVALGLGLMITAIHLRLGITGVAWATLVSYGLHSASLLWFALGNLHERPGRRVAFVLRLFTPLTIAIPLAWACNRFMILTPDHGMVSAARLVMAVAVFGAVYALLMLPLSRGLGIRELVSELRLPGLGLLRRNGTGADDGNP
jgi:O-antigen/teichoic acid export membrane protein